MQKNHWVDPLILAIDVEMQRRGFTRIGRGTARVAYRHLDHKDFLWAMELPEVEAIANPALRQKFIVDRCAEARIECEEEQRKRILENNTGRYWA